MNLQRTQLTLFFFFLFASLTTLCLCIPNDDEFSILNHNPAETFISEEQVVELFQQWKEKHNKVYNNEEEMKKRFENFRASLRFVTEKNLKKRLGSSTSSHFVGLNKFADMSNEEFKQKYMSKIRKTNTNKTIELKESGLGKVSTCDAPATLDWRKKGVVTAVKDQGQCGCCWAFSATGAIEGINALVTGDLISLSEQELVECDTNDAGCGGGLMDNAFAWIKSNGGLNTESAYPYTGYSGTCNTAKKQEKVVTIDGYEDISEEESALICAVVKQPISIAIVGSSYDFQLYSGGVFSGECSSNPNDVDHAVLVVGYDTEGDEEYWIAKNSWGTGWGMDGYMYIKKNTSLPYGVCAMYSISSYPTKKAGPPSPPSPPSPPPPPSPPSPPPSPSPSRCGDSSYCPSGTTCCCIVDFYDYCLLYGCCDYENAVCCAGSSYCCPPDYPICDVEEGLCLKFYGDSLGVIAKKRTTAKHKFPWTAEFENTENQYKPLQWKRNQLAALH